MGKLGVVLYEYLGEEYPEVLVSDTEYHAILLNFANSYPGINTWSSKVYRDSSWYANSTER